MLLEDDMAQLINNFSSEMAKMRSWSKIDERAYRAFMISSYKSGDKDIIETQFKLGLYPFITFPRIESYEVDMTIPLPQISQAEFDDVIEHYDFRRPWLMEITEQNGLGKLILHSGGVKDGLDFTEVTQLPNGRFAYSVLRLKDGVVKIATNQGNQKDLLETFYWIVRLFHAKHMTGYLDVTGGKKKHKSLGKSRFGNVTIKIFLSAKGKKYHYPLQPTQNPNYTSGKTEIEIEVRPFRKRVRCGKGRVNVVWKDIDPYHRKQWIVPRDKVTKIAS
jgi:hypothetical protein